MKVLTVVGARPQFVKAAIVSEALRSHGIRECLVHTGQHYDHNMSQLFFQQLAVPEPAINLQVGSGSHGQQTAAIIAALEPVVVRESPDLVLLYGDTNSTMAGALVASKLCIPIAHVEAGVRSFNRSMPEEVNRIVTDVLSTLLLCPTRIAVSNLAQEGITRGVHEVGDVMLDILLRALPKALALSTATELGLEHGRYNLATVHRAENTDVPERLRALIAALSSLDLPTVLPLHPRTEQRLRDFGIESAPGERLRFIPPVGYLEMLHLQAHATAILTDSGGVQKEAYFLGRPCITLRDETEWPETLNAGWNVLVGTDVDQIMDAAQRTTPAAPRHPYFGDGTAAGSIARLLPNGSP